jgi:release factor glutamine methyltransferase
VFAEDEAVLLTGDNADPAVVAHRLARRVAGEPLEHILGWVEFGGLRIAVDPGVFVPRRRSEFLVDQAVARAGHAPIVVDLCCGTGALGTALAHRVALGELHAADLDPAAVACAAANLATVGGVVHRGDLFAALPDRLAGRVDLLLVNAPDVPTDGIAFLPPEARLHEPRLALDGGADGLDLHRRVIAGAPAWLAAGGHLLIECGARQGATAAGLMRAAGLATCVAGSDDHDTVVVIGRRED